MLLSDNEGRYLVERDGHGLQHAAVLAPHRCAQTDAVTLRQRKRHVAAEGRVAEGYRLELLQDGHVPAARGGGRCRGQKGSAGEGSVC